MESGFRIVPAVFTAGELAPLSRAVAAVPRGRAGSRHLLAVGEVSAVAHDPRLIDLARDLVGPGAVPFSATLFDKSAGSNWLVAWHQDLALPVHQQANAPGWGPWTLKWGRLYGLAPADVLDRVVALRVHLNDSTSNNGPLRVLPGTHRFGRLSRARITELAREVQSVECVVAAGGVVAMRPLLLHASSKSRGTHSRRVLHVEYASSLVVAPGIELAVA